MDIPDAAYWKRKLAGFLHDPPSKALDIASHGERSATAYAQAGFSAEEVNRYSKQSDWTAAAADRFPFPSSQASGLHCKFDGVANTFRHPLCGQSVLKMPKALHVSDAAEAESAVQYVFAHFPDEWTEAEKARARFMVHWRLWPKHCAESAKVPAGALAWLPADTRLPDHTIWTHMQVVSALAGCAESDDPHAPIRPAFFKFQLGPVQEFIAASRSTRDLWSGSYLLSWLMAHALKCVVETVGPDAVIFPNLQNQPLVEFLLKDSLWSHVALQDGRNAWEHSLEPDPAQLTIPNLPNVFFAVVPEGRADAIGKAVEQAVREEWRKIADHVWDFCERKGPLRGGALDGELLPKERAARYDAQVDRFLSIGWQALPWPRTDAALNELAALLPPARPGEPDVKQIHREVVDAVTKTMPVAHRDARYYTDKQEKTRLNNLGHAWSVLFALNSWALDGVRQTRSFTAWADGGWNQGAFCNKDALNGLEEAVAGGREWKKQWNPPGREDCANLFRHDDWVGASTLIKRLWPFVYLKDKHGLRPVPMPNTQDLASGKRDVDSSEEDDDDDSDSGDVRGGYFAVLAFDGDQIGRWVSGTADAFPKFGTQLADYKEGVERRGVRVYFEKHLSTILEKPRPLTPSYHLQLSQALSNFAVHAARRVVEAHKGRLIYAGGDDVLAMLPADTALACAADLRRAFRGEAVPAAGIEAVEGAGAGFLRLSDPERGEPAYPLLFPGPVMEASVGIAIAHAKAPLQDVVRAAQAAEKRAKRATESGGEGRAAFAITLFKRSGETVEWGGRWESGAADALLALIDALHSGTLASRFPQKLSALIDQYLSATRGSGLSRIEDLKDFPLADVLDREFRHVVARQEGGKGAALEPVRASVSGYFAALAHDFAGKPMGPSAGLQRASGLCACAAFIARNSSEENSQS